MKMLVWLLKTMSPQQPTNSIKTGHLPIVMNTGSRSIVETCAFGSTRALVAAAGIHSKRVGTA